MDLDRDSLELMLNLLDTESRIKDALDGSGMDKRELDKNRKKVSLDQLHFSFTVLMKTCY
jgi:hypothetical protein